MNNFLSCQTVTHIQIYHITFSITLVTILQKEIRSISVFVVSKTMPKVRELIFFSNIQHQFFLIYLQNGNISSLFD